VGRPRTGSRRWRQGNLFAVISYKDERTGEQKFKERRVLSNKLTDLPKVIRELENEFSAGGKEAIQETIEASKMTFERAAREYEKEHMQAAEIVGGRKIAGLKNTNSPAIWLERLIEHFGKKPIRKISAKEIRRYKNIRLKTPTLRNPEKTYAVASVNRELELLRSIFRYAHGHGWVLKNPFILAKGLINKSDETERMTILSPEQEAKILAQCVGAKRSHLRSVIVIGIDTFMRSGELFSLVKSDIDFDSRVVRVRWTTTKTERSREIGLTQRAYDELVRLTEHRPADAKVFEVGSVKTSWGTVCEKAGLEDVRIHDLRHTGITRRLKAVVKAGLPWHIVMKESGHTQIKTFMRYFNPDDEMLAQAAKAMSEMYGQGVTAPISDNGRQGE
jgi:integrase